ncbi:glycosyltransferase family 39 protein [Parafrankia discariae]|uniref:glycosyltransferase family 39 protein n=1 Tax=Parafrankia discariae TaxID=365528 RepID=UPI00035E07EF
MEPTGRPAPDTRETIGPRGAGDVLALVTVSLLAVVVQAVLWERFRQPLWYDELWRPHFVAEPAGTFWSELSVANTPSAIGSMGLLRVCGDVFGWHAWALRLPSAVPLVTLAAGTWLLGRRLTGRAAAFAAALTVTLAGTVVDLASQVKPYTLDAACAVAVVMLWTRAAPTTRALLWSRFAVGVLALFSLPALFLIVPLTVLDVARPTARAAAARPAIRSAVHAVLCDAPAVVVAGLHAALFVLHQSGQRASTFWDDHFLAGRGPLDGIRFVADQLAATAAGAPPGIDRYDPNLVHPLTDSSDPVVIVLGCAVAIAFAAGAVTLSRRPDGRVLLVATGGAELMVLAASAGRYWPFGAVRTNVFVVPLLTVVAAAGAAALARAARDAWAGARPAGGQAAGRRGAAAVLLAAVTAVTVLAAAAVPAAAVSALRPLWEERGERRPIDLMVDATVTARRLYRPGDLVVVGGRLARAGWLYGMEVSQDGAADNRTPGQERPRPGAEVVAGPVGPRVRRSSTVFLTAIGDGGVGRTLARRAPGPAGRVLLFVLAYDRRGTARALAEAQAAGWCPAWTHDFELTGTLRVLTPCEGRAGDTA